MSRFPVDAPLSKVIKTLERLGFQIVREGNHIAMLRENPDGSRTPLTLPNHKAPLALYRRHSARPARRSRGLVEPL